MNLVDGTTYVDWSKLAEAFMIEVTNVDEEKVRKYLKRLRNPNALSAPAFKAQLFPKDKPTTISAQMALSLLKESNAAWGASMTLEQAKKACGVLLKGGDKLNYVNHSWVVYRY